MLIEKKKMEEMNMQQAAKKVSRHVYIYIY